MIHFMLTSVYGVGYRSTLFSSMPPSFFFLTFHMCLIVSFENQIRSVAQSCPTLCDPRDDSPPGSPVPGILQARTLEWVAISFSNA